MEQRANIKFCFKLGKTATETFQMVQKVYGDKVLSRSSVFDWYKRLQHGRESLEDDEHTGRPRSGRSPEEIMKVSDILKNDRCVSTRLLEDMTGIGKSTIHRILTEDLQKRKVCAKFVPHSLNDDQKQPSLCVSIWLLQGSSCSTILLTPQIYPPVTITCSPS